MLWSLLISVSSQYIFKQLLVIPGVALQPVKSYPQAQGCQTCSRGPESARQRLLETFSVIWVFCNNNNNFTYLFIHIMEQLWPHSLLWNHLPLQIRSSSSLTRSNPIEHVRFSLALTYSVIFPQCISFTFMRQTHQRIYI